jgi:hypothetical protein
MWAEDSSWDYCTPICVFNSIIWLQAVVEIITNETAKGRNILPNHKLKYATPSTKLFGFGLFASLGGWSVWKVQSE